MDKLIVIDETANSRKIPAARFFENISDAFDGKYENVEGVAKAYAELLGKYQLMTASLLEQQKKMQMRVQSLEDAREVVNAAVEMQAKGRTAGNEVLFKANDCLYARAEVTDPSKVMLWLGSNTLMEYSPDEAVGVLATNLDATKDQLERLVSDIAFLKEQITVVEVANTRLHNWVVSNRPAQPNLD
eukprot:Blabericola_migrator_1__2254@NODE_1622_length_4149_cov_39_027438_g1057_i0_p2_GENE_NODE_1622_length_4149_cov_39_027438_g1057_i0NODE_1622_length_4149_cov_39_027438_g1057_i0_p2_ORF_typecomplete_len187_score40_60Prefoldin/PF02996_17/5_6e23CLZ/PF16526_5/0_73CLZ/PF16526_5/80Prefoldin_2/PF01920_20/0_1T3SS_TC/PF06511_11/0_04YabA/PF06156_13/13YabA/PF06156_13/13BLOC1_2/PF10046_9/11BLOC1_2/PF10046_9/10DUF4201/PF13870_6/22DUF4201/PF13870_6/4_2COG2/PF06148_11/2_8COG2/PF06148_11/75BORCS7/PF16088_5/0_22BORCS7/